MQPKLDLTWFPRDVGIVAYLTMFEVVTIASYALWAGPQRFGITEPWPLVFFFVVPYLGTLLVASGIIAVIRAGPVLVRRLF